jgi:hypothetical protein
LPKGSAGVLSGKSKGAGLIKEEDRGEREFKIPNKIIILFVFFTGKDSNFIILSNSSLKMF